MTVATTTTTALLQRFSFFCISFASPFGVYFMAFEKEMKSCFLLAFLAIETLERDINSSLMALHNIHLRCCVEYVRMSFSLVLLKYPKLVWSALLFAFDLQEIGKRNMNHVTNTITTMSP